MPQSLRAPTRILVEDSSLELDAAVQASLADALEGTGAPPHLPDLGHALRVLLVAVGALVDRVGRRSPHLCQRLESLSALVDRIPGALGVQREVPVGDDRGLWTVLMLTDVDKAPRRLLELIGAVYWLGQSTGERASAAVIERLAQWAESTGTGKTPPELIAVLEMKAGPLWIRVSTSLMKGVQSKRTAASDVYEQRIERRLIAARAFVDVSRLDGIVATHDLTAEDVIDSAPVVRQRAESGDLLAFANCLGHWLGVQPYEVWHLRLFATVGSGLMRLSVDCTVVYVELSGLLADLAAATSGTQPTSDILPLVLPRWMAAILLELRRAEPEALSLKDATGVRLAPNSWMLTAEPTSLPRRISASRWIASRAQPLLDAKANQHLISICCLDPSRAGKSATHYQRVSLSEIVGILEQRSELLNWGPLACKANDLDAASGIGSRVTPLHSSITELVEARSKATDRSRPGPNAGWSRLIEHGNHVVLHTLLACSLGWALRGQRNIHPSALLMSEYELRGWQEKRLSKAAGAPSPLVCGIVLRRQLELLQAHYRTMVARGRHRIDSNDARLREVLNLFERAAEGDDGVPLLLFVEAGGVRAAHTSDLAWGLNLDWEHKRDALRHYAADAFRIQGSPAELVEDLLRHVANSSQLFSAAAGISIREWTQHAGNAQDRLLTSVGLRAIPGLVSRVRRGGRQ